MNLWARMLAELPATGQRVIARTQRISLPRGCDAATRHLRLRQALCHAATVRATYQALEPTVQRALQDLRARRGGMVPDQLMQHYGVVRPWRQLAADPRPRTVAERLVLLGWLIERPATPRHPAHYLLPPELRRWLPIPLAVPTYGPAPAPELPSAIRAAATIMLACAERPLHLRSQGMLRRSELRCLAAHLTPLPENEAMILLGFVLPLLVDAGLLSLHAGVCHIAPAAPHFLDLPLAEQLDRLRLSWLGASNADACLSALLVDTTGIDWLLLRRRLCIWANALPQGQLLKPAALPAALAAALGPLADGHTHGFRAVDRVPWQPQRAAAVFLAALRGPLHWLGLVAWDDRQYVFRLTLPNAVAPSAGDDSPGWAYGRPGVLHIPHDQANAALLRLQPYARVIGADAATLTLEITGRTLAAAAGQGWSDAALWALLEQQAGPVPAAWRAAVAMPQTTIQVQADMAVITAPPAVMARACRARSVRRYVATQLAPGIALVRPEHVPALKRALARQQIACAGDAAMHEAPAPHSATSRDSHRARGPHAPAVEHPGDWAALLVACAFYREHAPPEAPLIPYAELEARLAGQLPPALRQATETAIAALRPAAQIESEAAPQPLPLGETLKSLRAAQECRRTVTIVYNAADQGTWTRRVVRPLALEQHGDTWYLRAYCTARQAERTFRVDRIGDVAPG
jgi:hypothetical protein